MLNRSDMLCNAQTTTGSIFESSQRSQKRSECVPVPQRVAAPDFSEIFDPGQCQGAARKRGERHGSTTGHTVSNSDLATTQRVTAQPPAASPKPPTNQRAARQRGKRQVGTGLSRS